MAYIDKQKDSGPAQVKTRGGASGSISSGSSGFTPQAPIGSPGSGTFTNIQDYIEANAPKTAQMGQAIQKGFDTKQEGVLSSITKAGDIAEDATRQGEKQRIAAAPEVYDSVFKSTIDNTDVDQGKLKTFKDYLGGQGFKTSDADFNAADNQRDFYQKEVDTIRNPGQLTKHLPVERFGRGKEAFDQLILGQDPNIAQGIYESAEQGQQKFQTRREEELGQSRAVEGETLGERERVTSDLINRGDSHIKTIEDGVQQRVGEAQAEQDRILQPFRVGDMSGQKINEFIELAGWDSVEGDKGQAGQTKIQEIDGLIRRLQASGQPIPNFSNYITVPGITVRKVISEDEFQSRNSLYELLGKKPSNEDWSPEGPGGKNIKPKFQLNNYLDALRSAVNPGDNKDPTQHPGLILDQEMADHQSEILQIQQEMDHVSNNKFNSWEEGAEAWVNEPSSRKREKRVSEGDEGGKVTYWEGDQQVIPDIPGYNNVSFNSQPGEGQQGSSNFTDGPYWQQAIKYHTNHIAYLKKLILDKKKQRSQYDI